MRGILKISFVCLLLFAILIPEMALSDQLPARMQKAILPGTTEVTYVGETFVFTTTVPILVTFEPVDFTRIKLSFEIRGYQSGGGYIPSSMDHIQIYWEDFNTQLFSGPPPGEPWEVTVDTESGYTEK